MAKARVQTVKDLAGSRFDWEQALRDLSRAIPADVTLNVAHRRHRHRRRRRRQRSCAARSPRPRSRSQGCAPGQTQVARLMARLHDIDGVTRVSLSKSAAERSTTPATTTASEIEQRNATPCGVGKRPAFEVVMFFEKDAAAVATTPTTATGTVERDPDADPDRDARRPTATAPRPPTTTTTQPQGGATP